MSDLSPGLSHAATLDRLRGLLDVAAAVRTGDELPAVLASVAAAIAGPLGYGAVVINLYRPAWDDFEVVVVLGNEESQELLMGQTSRRADWDALIAPRFLRHGAYFVPAGEYDWSRDGLRAYTPDIPVVDDPGAWHPDDALMVPLRSASGEVLGIVSVDEPVTGRRPAQVELELLSAVAAHVAIAVEQAQSAAEGRRHRAAVEHLLRVSSQLTGRNSAEEMLDAVCDGIREALGFQKVMVFLADHPGGHLVPLSGVGFTAEQVAGFPAFPLEVLPPLLDAAFLSPRLRRDGRTPRPQRRTPPDIHGIYSSVNNGRGPRAWYHHWLVVPLHDRDGRLAGMVWVDDPEDCLLPSDE